MGQPVRISIRQEPVEKTPAYWYRNNEDNHLNFDMTIQRPSQRSLLWEQKVVESVLNMIDIGTIAIVASANFDEIHRKVYTVIDGRKRLKAIFDFMDDKFPLSDDAVIVSYNGDIQVGGLYYSDLKQIPEFSIRMWRHRLSILIIERGYTDDEPTSNDDMREFIRTHNIIQK